MTGKRTVVYERNGVSYYAVPGEGRRSNPARECARCGGTPSMIKVSLKKVYCSIPDEYYVQCDDCAFQSAESKSLDTAVASWNQKNYQRSHRPAWLPYAIITAGAVILTAINVATTFVH